MNGMGDSEDEHNFSDDDLDGLPDDAFVKLEQNALSSTQYPRQIHTNPPEQNVAPAQREHVEGLPTPAGIPQARLQVQQTYHRAPYRKTENEDDGGYLDDASVATPVEEKEAFIPQRIIGDMTQREQWRQARYAYNAQDYVQEVLPKREVGYHNYQHPVAQDSGHLGPSYAANVSDAMLLENPFPSHQYAVPVADEGLRLRLEELIRERDELTKELHSTKDTVLTQKGEIAIIRANQSKESKVFDRQLSALKKSMQDESARSKATLQAVTEESRKISDQNTFLKQDLAEEVERSKKLSRTLKDRPQTNAPLGIATTPQKIPAQSLRDGFDDDEIMAISPVRSGRRSKGGTPTAGGKRKRKIDLTSPVPALVLRPSNSVAPIKQEPETSLKAEKSLPILHRDLTAEKNLKFMQRILNHRMNGHKDRVIETCMAYCLPSTPNKTFTTAILEATTRLSGPRAPADLLAVFAQLWSGCLAEKYYIPIALLMDTISFIVALCPSVLDAGTLHVLLPVLQSSAEINAATRFRHSPVAYHKLGHFRQTPQSELQPLMNGSACLEMLYDLATRSLDLPSTSLNTPNLTSLFWRSISTDFVLMMLNSSQPINDITLMLHLLSTSIQPSTFGNICSTPLEQSKMETYIVDRVCWLLWETPRVDEGVKPYTKFQICTLRLSALELLTSLAAVAASPNQSQQKDSNKPPPHGLTLLTNHPAATARITRLIYDSLDALNIHPPTHALHSRLINNAVPLLAALTLPIPGSDGSANTNTNTTSISTRLAAVNGGVHKHRVALTRLAFSDGVFLDAAIADRTVRLATEMLEEAVTPEEAEGLVAAFPGWRGRGARSGSASTGGAGAAAAVIEGGSS